MQHQKNLLLIFTRNPELGKCKTRLAATIGDQAALEIYKFLLNHTVSVTEKLDVTKQVHYSVKVRENDIWDANVYSKEQQKGIDLGVRMHHAFDNGFKEGFENIIIIGSDLFDITQIELEEAFDKLRQNDFVVGPAQDGGYYLLGMKKLKSELFKNKEWGTATVLENSLSDLSGESVFLLPEKNDIDYYEDIKDEVAFQPFLKHIKQA